jgi:Benzoate membrane transport protein
MVPALTAPHPRSFMFTRIERPAQKPAAPGKVVADFGLLYASNGFIGWLFAVTAPAAIILAVGSNGGLSEGEIASWIFAAFFINGLLTILFCWLYRQPLAFFWTIPGTVLVGQSLTHLSFHQVVGAYYATGVLMLVLGATGSVKRAMEFVPMPIVMGMVAGVFLRFGLDLVHATFADTVIAGPMIATWLLLSSLPGLGRRCPPIIGALVVGALATIMLGRFDASAPLQFELIRPALQTPAWSAAAMVELVVPLAITVLVVQNGQGPQGCRSQPADRCGDRRLRNRRGRQRSRGRHQHVPDGTYQCYPRRQRRARTAIYLRDCRRHSGDPVRPAGTYLHPSAAQCAEVAGNDSGRSSPCCAFCGQPS